MVPTDSKCEVCGKETAVTIMCAFNGHWQHGYCQECKDSLREPWNTLVSGLAGCRKDTILDDIKPIIKATCNFYNKTEDEFWKAVEQFEEAVAIALREIETVEGMQDEEF